MSKEIEIDTAKKFVQTMIDDANRDKLSREDTTEVLRFTAKSLVYVIQIIDKMLETSKPPTMH